MINYQFKINMQGERERYENLVFTTGDKNGYRLEFVFYSNGKRFDTSLCGLTVKAKRADGVLIIDSGITTGEGAYYDVADNAYGIKGELEFEVALVKADGSYATTQVISAQVREGFGESGLSSEDNEPVLAKLEGQYLECRAAEDSNSKLIAENTKRITVNAGTIKTNTYRIANLESNVVMPAITAYDEINYYEERVPTGTIVTYSSVFKAKGLLFGGESETDIAICRMTDLIDTTIPTATETVVVTRGDNISIWERNLGITERTDSDGNNYYIVIDSSEEFVLISETDLSSAINTNAEAIAENTQSIEGNKANIDIIIDDLAARPTSEWAEAVVTDLSDKEERVSALENTLNNALPDLDAEIQGNKVNIEIIQADMYNDKKEARSIFANALKGTASGETIRIDDISPVEHNLAVKVRKKNLVDINNPSSVPNGAVYEVDNGVATVTRGTSIYAPSINWVIGDYADFVGKTLTVSVTVTEDNGTYATNLNNIVYFTGSKGSNLTYTTLQSQHIITGTKAVSTFTISENAEVEKLCIRLYLQRLINPEESAKFTELQVEVGETTTDLKPYIEDISVVKLKTWGKNLLNINNIRAATNTATLEISENSTVKVVSTVVKQASLYCRIGKYQDFVGKTLTLSVNLTEVTDSATYKIFNSYYRGADADGNLAGSDIVLGTTSISVPGQFTFTVAENENAEYLELRFYVGYMFDDVGYTATLTQLQLEAGDTATDYEPYKESAEYEVSADGTVSGATSIYPNMTLLADTNGAVIDAGYNRDTNKAFQELANAIIALGGTI